MGKIKDFIKELREGIRELPEELKKPHNKIRFFSIASNVIILGSWAVLRYGWKILLVLLVISLAIKVILSLHLARKI